MKFTPKFNNVVDADFKIIEVKRASILPSVFMMLIITVALIFTVYKNFESITGISFGLFHQRLTELFDPNYHTVISKNASPERVTVTQKINVSPFSKPVKPLSDELPAPVSKSDSQTSSKPPSKTKNRASGQAEDSPENINVDLQVSRGITEFAIGETAKAQKP